MSTKQSIIRREQAQRRDAYRAGLTPKPPPVDVLSNCAFLPGLYGGNYSHSGNMQLGVQNEMDSDVLEESTEVFKQWVTSVEDEMEPIRELMTDIADALYKQLETEYDYRTSDEQVWEAIEANDLFDASDYEDDEEVVALAA